MTFANVNIGANPADGTGDPLRTAFNTINQNFANIAAGAGFAVNAPVSSVAGRTGNIILTINDIVGANNAVSTAQLNLVNQNVAVLSGRVDVNTDNINTVNSNVQTLSANVGGFYTYANATFINNYSNTNVAAYLTTATITTSGNITAGNLIATHYGNVIGATATHTGNVTVNGVTALTGNLAVDGGQATIYDSILDLHTYGNLASWTTDDGKDIGLRMHYYNGVDSLAFLGLENATRTLQYLINATETNSNVSGTFGNAQLGSLVLSNTTASTGTTIGTAGALYVAGGAGVAGNLSVGNNLTVTGNINQQAQYYQTYSNVTNTGGNLTLNFVNGATYYANLTANVTANIVNISNTAFTTAGFTVIVDQGAIPYRIANIQFAGGTVSNIKWAGATVPTGTASNTDVISITLINLNNGAYRILGQQRNYG